MPSPRASFAAPFMDNEPGFAVVTPDGTAGLLRFGGETLRCAIGRGGSRVEKREGDGATPVGHLPLRRVLFRADRLAPVPVASGVPLEPIAPSDGWCDDPAHAAYNRAVSLPFDGRHERLWRDDAVYDLVGVLGWNDDPPRRDRGSAIFLHLSRPGYAPTEGCIALPEPELRRLLARGLRGLSVMPD